MTSETAALPQSTFERTLHFGRFELDPARKLLLDDGRAVRVGGRALDLLIALAERAGEVVSHEDLIASVWPDTVVEESSLRVHMSSLRKVLGDGVDGQRYITSLAGRGYSFVMAVAPPHAPPADAPAPPPAEPAAFTLPPRLTGLVGREQVLASLVGKLQQRRLLTIVGAGGIGKTSVALALAEVVGARHAEGAVFVDLAPVSDPALVPATLAAALGIPVPAQSAWPTLEATLAARDFLIVLDNCEHLVAAAASLAERILAAAPRVRLLATSREPLDAESEAIHRLEALAVPPAGQALDVESALGYAALRLFVERASASADDFALAPTNLAAVVLICRHLDGLPLAIELAAARVGSLGIHALAERLDDLFRLLRRARRNVLPRQQTLQALLDWSHDLLDADERRVLHRLSTFRASFTLEAALAVAACDHVPRERVVTSLLNLVSRSLVELDAGEVPRYRLLFATRVHSAELLLADGDAPAVRGRHAVCLRDVLARANAALAAGDAGLSAWQATHAAMLPDIRAALDWAEGADGDPVLAISLLVEATRLVMEMGWNDEFQPRALRALAVARTLDRFPEPLELELLATACILDARCCPQREFPADIAPRLEQLALRVGSPRQQRAALMSLFANGFARGDYRRAAECAGRYASLARDPDDPADIGATVIGRRFGAMASHYLGEHRAAWAGCVAVLEHADAGATGHRYPHLPLRMSMGIQQARILWLQGAADRALDRALEVLAFVEGKQALALSQALGMAVIPILLWRGDDQRALAYTERLARNALDTFESYWLAWSDSYCNILALRGLDVHALRLRIGPRRGWTSASEGDMLGTLAQELAGPEQLQRVEAGLVGWCAPEILRAHGDRLWSAPAHAARAEPVLARALALARHQGARAWELRCARSVAELWHATGRERAARDLLAGTVDTFTEGLDCADLRRAGPLLERWR
jgi:predicted ATPase/DNA-binding winged helix-turn-helix (wHTH) protein